MKELFSTTTVRHVFLTRLSNRLTKQWPSRVRRFDSTNIGIGRCLALLHFPTLRSDPDPAIYASEVYLASHTPLSFSPSLLSLDVLSPLSSVLSASFVSNNRHRVVFFVCVCTKDLRSAGRRLFRHRFWDGVNWNCLCFLLSLWRSRTMTHTTTK